MRLAWFVEETQSEEEVRLPKGFGQLTATPGLRVLILTHRDDSDSMCPKLCVWILTTVAVCA